MFKKSIEINIWILGIFTIILMISICFNLKPTAVSPLKSSQVGFEKKQDCAVYKRQIEDKFDRNNNGELVNEYYYFDRIFYSPTENSCLFIYSGSFGLRADERYRTLYLEDALSGDVLIQATVIEKGKYMNDNQAYFDTRVRAYKGE